MVPHKLRNAGTGMQIGWREAAASRRPLGIGFGGMPTGQRIDVIGHADDPAVPEAAEMTLPMEPGRFRSPVPGPDGSFRAGDDRGIISRSTPERPARARWATLRRAPPSSGGVIGRAGGPSSG